MNTHGKHYPNRVSRFSTKSSGKDDKNGVQLTKLNGQEISSSDDAVPAPEIEMKTPLSVMKKSTYRLCDAIFPQVGSTHRTFRIIWILIYIGLIVVFSVYLHGITNKYLSYPTTTEMTIETVSSLEFPAVTICNENPIPKSKITRFRKYADFQTLDNFTTTFLNVSAAGLYQNLNSTHMKCPAGKF